MTHFILSTVKWKYHKSAKSKDKNYLVGERPKIKLTIFQWNFPIWIKQKLFSFFFRYRQLDTFLISLRCTRMEFSYSVKIFFAFNSNDIIIPDGRCATLYVYIHCIAYLKKSKDIFTFTFLIAVRREHCNTLDVYGFSCTANFFSWNQHSKDWHCHNNFIKKQNWRKKFVNLFRRLGIQVDGRNLKIRLIKYFLWLYFPFFYNIYVPKLPKSFS